MILGGDEFGRSQKGNNNAYCQDSSIGWYDWKKQDVDMLRFTRAMIALRKDNDCLRKLRFFDGKEIPDSTNKLRNIQWFTPEGAEMSDLDWQKPYNRAVAVLIAGEKGQHDLFVIFNAADKPLTWQLPKVHEEWDGVLNTALGDPFMFVEPFRDTVDAPEWSVVVLRAEALYNK
jgi:glycogen operon protein